MVDRPRRAWPALVAAAVLALVGAGPGAGASGPACPPAGRSARVTVPSTPAGPVLVLFHGYGSSAAEIAGASGLERPAAASGAAVVVPDGTGSPPRWALAGRLEGGDDLAFVEALLDACTPEAAVVLAGFSNGAAFAAEVACRLGARVVGLVLVGGASLAAPCPEGEPVPTVVVHGGDDRVVPVAGGPVLGATLHAAPLADAVEARRAGGSPVRVVVVPGWGHRWPPVATDETLALLRAS